jgi:hypothetical protein
MAPTALMYVSSRLIDTLRTALQRCYEAKQHADQIWIILIYVPSINQHVYDHAEDLAKRWRFEGHDQISV